MFQFLFVLCCCCLCQSIASSSNHHNDIASASAAAASSSSCHSELDLNFVDCFLDDLDSSALMAICERMGLNEEEHVRPYLEGNRGSHEYYVTAALECLQAEQYLMTMIEDGKLDPVLLEQEQQEQTAAAGGGETTAEAIDLDVLAHWIMALEEHNPEALVEMTKTMQTQKPELWGSLQGLGENPNEALAVLLQQMAEGDDEERPRV